MKKSSFLFILLGCLLQLGFGLKSTDICNLAHSDGFKDDDGQMRIQICSANHPHKCTSDYCAVDKKSCIEILKMNSFLESMHKSNSYRKELNHFTI